MIGVQCKPAKETTSVVQEAKVEVENIQEGIFFKVQKEELVPSYLLGTINTIDHENYVWGDKFRMLLNHRIELF